MLGTEVDPHAVYPSFELSNAHGCDEKRTKEARVSIEMARERSRVRESEEAVSAQCPIAKPVESTVAAAAFVSAAIPVPALFFILHLLVHSHLRYVRLHCVTFCYVELGRQAAGSSGVFDKIHSQTYTRTARLLLHTHGGRGSCKLCTPSSIVHLADQPNVGVRPPAR